MNQDDRPAITPAVSDLGLFTRIARAGSFFDEELLTDRSGLIPAQRSAGRPTTRPTTRPESQAIGDAVGAGRRL